MKKLVIAVLLLVVSAQTGLCDWLKTALTSLYLLALIGSASFATAQISAIPEGIVSNAFAERGGALVIIDVECQNKTYVFACTSQGENVMSKDARAIVETVLEKQGLL